MKKLNHVVFIVLLVIVNSCNKDKEYTLTGRLMASCDVPMPNTVISLKQDVNMLNQGGFLGDFSTDENGYFNIVYTPERGGALRFVSNGSFFENIPAYQNLDLGNVYYGASVNFNISLEVTNPYTDQDTLEYGNPITGQSEFIPGPFQSGQIQVVNGAFFTGFPIIYGNTPQMYVGSILHTTSGIVSIDEARFDVTPCDGSYGEAVIKIE